LIERNNRKTASMTKQTVLSEFLLKSQETLLITLLIIGVRKNCNISVEYFF
jgi:hypothetical protein